MKKHEQFAIPMQGCREANWPGRRRASAPRDVHQYIEHACMSWCKHVWTCVDWPSGNSSSCRGGRVKAASGLPAKVGTTRLSCGVGGQDGLDSASRYGEMNSAGGLPAKVGTTRLSCGVGGRDGQPLVIARLTMER
ncbi:hypothetical protein CDL15_Pgr011693 [Punica granatum]|nr:hypothetical protein CDL15_Pgr011693 [Punica granatum]